MGNAFRSVYKDRLLLDSEAAPGGFIAYYADGEEEIIHANRYIIDLFECDSVNEFLELTQGTFRHFVYSDDLAAAEDSIWGQVRKRSGMDHVYYRIKTKTGKLVSVTDYGKIVQPVESGRPYFEVFISPVSPDSFIDWLTGLSGMVRFYDLAHMGASTLAARGERTVAVAFDIMGMKTFNTRFSRAKGDELLCAFAEALRGQFGSEACSRFGEDHFCAFAAERGIENKVNAVFANFDAAAGFELVPPVRAGLYACDAEDDIAAIGFDRAKIACDLDRTTWQSHFMWYTEEMRAAAHLRIHVLECLDQAIREGWIRAYYQPVVRSSTGKVCEEEALARWVDPVYGVLTPDKFIPVLEEAALLHRLDLHIIDCVLADFKKKREMGVPIVPVSVNISYRDLARFDVAHEIAMRTDKAGIPHDLLHIEFTESAIQSDPKLFMTQVAALHDNGFEVWMDDFGSGYSSLNVLQEYEFDVIKLDMEFLRGAASDTEKARIIVAGIVQTANKLGVRTLCEGVETERQAAFLEGIGCDMLQGYLFSSPNPLDVIAQRVYDGVGLPREERDEEAYWNAVCNFSLTDFSNHEDGQGIEGIAISEFPAGVLERRNGTWHVARDNRSFGDFLERAGIVEQGHSGLRVNVVKREMDEEFYMACARSAASGEWEHIAGRLEYGSGFQFYVRPMSSTPVAEAYAVVGVPTMLGTALGAFGDVPVGYAVFRVLLNEAGDAVVDAEYVYANDLYRQWAGFDDLDLTGRSFLETAPNASDLWFPYCYRAAVLGEEVHDTVFSPEAGHWMNFHLAPSPVEGCCVYAFSLADDEHREREEMIMGRTTSDLIITLADELSGEASYDVAMSGLLESMSRIIHPDRLYVFERGEQTTSNTFEWCAEGVEPQMDTLQQLDNALFDSWDALLGEDRVVLITDADKIADVDEHMHWQLVRQGITRLLAVPLYSGDELIGYVCADNYRLEERLDTVRLLKTVASFVSSRIVNRRLLDQLERLGTRDELTDLPSRRGVDLAIAERLSTNPGEPFSLALMDIDDFKMANDLYGHEVGDGALHVIARAICSAFPPSVLIGRNGGDEFLAVAFGKDAGCMDASLARVMESELCYEFKGVRHNFSLSAGYVSFPDQVGDLRNAYSKADAALYAVKLAGKRGYRRYTPAMETHYRQQCGFTPRDIAESVPGCIVVHRPGDGEILFANDELVQLLECEDLLEFMKYTGGTFGGIVHPDDRTRVRDELAEQMTIDDVGGKDYVDFRVLTKKGNVRHVADNGRLVHLEGVGDVFYELILNYDERGVR